MTAASTDNTVVQTAFRLPASLYKQLKVTAAVLETTSSALAVEAITEKLERIRRDQKQAVRKQRQA